MEYLDGVQDAQAVTEADDANDILPAEALEILPSEIHFSGISVNEGEKEVECEHGEDDGGLANETGDSLAEEELREEEEGADLIDIDDQNEADVVNDLVNLDVTGDSLASVESRSSNTNANVSHESAGSNVHVTSHDEASLALFYDEATSTLTTTALPATTPTNASLTTPTANGQSLEASAPSISCSTRASTPLLSTPPPPGLSSPLVDPLLSDWAVSRFDAISNLGFDEVVFESEKKLTRPSGRQRRRKRPMHLNVDGDRDRSPSVHSFDSPLG